MAAADAAVRPDTEHAMRTLQPHPNLPCDRRLDLAMRRIVLVGAVLVLAVPAARGDSVWLGALPLGLLGRRLARWWALHRVRRPRWPQPATTTSPRRRRSASGQARRRGGTASRRERMPLRMA
jgi:hypothetical protein